MNNVSIVITYSGKLKLFSRCLDSLKNQIRLGDEFIIMNDSKDDMSDFIDMYSLENKGTDVTSNNMVLARNLGVNHATNDILIFLDEDILASEDLVDRYRETIPQFKVVCGCIVWLKQDGNVKMKDFRAGRIPDSAKKTITIANFLAEEGMGGGGNFAIDKELFLSVGGFDLQYNGAWGEEDIDLFRTIIDNGYNIYYSDAAVAYHQFHVRNLKGYDRNKEIFRKKWKCGSRV